MKKRAVIGAALGAYVAPLFVGQRQPLTPGPRLSELISQAQESGLTGWELVSFAANLVHDQFELHSCRTPWQGPETALRARRGFCTQYNGVLYQVLTGLGFDARLIFAARVRTDANPWFHMGHVWVRVVLDGRGKDVCARYGRTAGRVEFVPVTETRNFGSVSYLDTVVPLCLVVAGFQWRFILTGQPLPRWLERDFNAAIDS